MDLIYPLSLGFKVALSTPNLVYALAGCLLGTLVGVLPGIGPVVTIAMLLPLTTSLPPVAALILLSGIYYGAQYGGSTPAILLNQPGGASSVSTAIDGYQMARQGRAGPALAAAALGSFFAGCVATLILALLATPMSELAYRFGPAEYFSLILLGLVGSVVLASGSLLKAVAMVVLGLLLGLVGIETDSAGLRLPLGMPGLSGGVGFIAIAMGVFGYGEIIDRLARADEPRRTPAEKVGALRPTAEDLRQMVPSVLRGTGLGTLLGMLPGGGALLSAIGAYTAEKKVRLQVGEIPFGRGNIRGVAASESANNAGAHAAFVPLLAWGIPSNPVMALMLGAMLVHHIQPGPQVMASHPGLFWGLVASMWLGNLLLITLNLPLIGLWVRLLAVPYRWLFPAVVLFCAIGIYTIHNSIADVWLVASCGVAGYLFIKLGLAPAPLLLGFILGPMLEDYLRRALLLSHGDWGVFVMRPVSASLLVVVGLLLLIVLLPTIKPRREEAMVEG